MSHVDDGELNALLDGELLPEAARAVEAHVATCAACTQRLSEARAFLAGAGELLAKLTPPARAAQPAAPPVAAASSAAPQEPRVVKTSKEIAVSLDGRTEMTPAIRPVFPHEVPAPRRRSWQLPDLEKLAWAASLVLCLGVGYLANEVYHLRLRQTETDVGRPEQMVATPADAVAPATRSVAPESRQARELATRPAAGPGAAAPPKPRVTKPAPALARPRAEEIAASGPVPDRSATSQVAPARLAAAPAEPDAPTNRPPAAPSRAANALADMTGASAGQAPPAARSNAGAGARSADTVGRLDEAAEAADRMRAPVASAPPAFQRVPMEEAVRRLSGSIRLIDGMNASRVDVGPGQLVPGADPERDVVRVTYAANGRRLVLDQQLGDTRQGASFNGLMQGDTLVTTAPSGGTQVRWVDRKFWLSLTGTEEPDSLRALVERIR